MIISNDIKLLSKAKSLGFDFNKTPRNQTPILHHAALKGNLVILDFLLDNNCDPNTKNTKDGTTPIFYAKNAGTCTTLIKRGANCNIDDNNGNNPLLNEIKKGKSISDLNKKIKPLLKHTDINLTNNRKETALMLASRYGYNKLVDTLIKLGANVNSANLNNQNAVSYAFHGAENTDYENQLKRYRTIILQLIDNGISIDVNAITNKNEKSLVNAATKNNHRSFGQPRIKIIQAAGNLDKYGTKSENILRLLLQSHPYHYADTALKNGTSVNNKEFHDQPLTGCITYFNKNKIGAKNLLDLGANPLIKDHENMSFLDHCIEHVVEDSFEEVNFTDDTVLSTAKMIDYIIENYDIDPNMKSINNKKIIEILSENEELQNSAHKLENKALKDSVSKLKLKNKKRVNL